MISQAANCHFVERQLSFCEGGGMWSCLSYGVDVCGYLLTEMLRALTHCGCGVANDSRMI